MKTEEIKLDFDNILRGLEEELEGHVSYVLPYWKNKLTLTLTLETEEYIKGKQNKIRHVLEEIEDLLSIDE